MFIDLILEQFTVGRPRLVIDDDTKTSQGKAKDCRHMSS